MDSKSNQRNRTWETHKLIKPTLDLRDPQPTTHTGLERAMTHDPRPMTHVGLDAPTNRDGAMIHGEDEKLGVGSDGKREMGWESSNRVRREL